MRIQQDELVPRPPMPNRYTTENIELIKSLSEKMKGSDILRVEYLQDVAVPSGGRRRGKEGRVIEYKTIFTKGDSLYLNPRKCHRGYSAYDFSLDLAKKIEVVSKLKEESNLEQILRLKNPKMWKKADFRDNGNKVQYLTSNKRIPKRVIEEMRKAIDENKEYRWNSNGEKRDISIHITPDTGDGEGIQGWYNSEYAGCGNGAYYYLIDCDKIVLNEYD